MCELGCGSCDLDEAEVYMAGCKRSHFLTVTVNKPLRACLLKTSVAFTWCPDIITFARRVRQLKVRIRILPSTCKEITPKGSTQRHLEFTNASCP